MGHGAVQAIAPAGPAALKQILADRIAAAHFAKNSGDHRKWALAWATDTVKQARVVYQGIQFGHWDTDADHQEFVHISFDDAAHYKYKKAEMDVVTTQLAKAAWHLAELLNAIHWQ